MDVLFVGGLLTSSTQKLQHPFKSPQKSKSETDETPKPPKPHILKNLNPKPQTLNRVNSDPES